MATSALNNNFSITTRCLINIIVIIMFILMTGHYLDALVLVVLIQFNESFQAVSLENKGNVCYTSVSQFIDLESNK